jgi:hypothetical protein
MLRICRREKKTVKILWDICISVYEGTGVNLDLLFTLTHRLNALDEALIGILIRFITPVEAFIPAPGSTQHEVKPQQCH